MPNTNTAAAGVSATDLESIEASLADLDLDASAGAEEVPVEEIIEEVIEASAEEEVIEEVVLEADAEEVVEETAEGETEIQALDDDALGDLELAVAKDEVYASQTSTTDADAGAVKTAKANAGKKGAGKKSSTPKEKKEGVARTPRDISTVPAEFFALTAEQAAEVDLDAVKAKTMTLIPGQKKIAEKFENLFTALSVNKAPSTYVMIAFKLLDEKKTVTSADVIGAYKTAGLGEGTARSQSGQIMNLFATVGIATRSGQTLTLNDNSKIAERIRDLPQAA